LGQREIDVSSLKLGEWLSKTIKFGEVSNLLPKMNKQAKDVRFLGSWHQYYHNQQDFSMFLQIVFEVSNTLRGARRNFLRGGGGLKF